MDSIKMISEGSGMLKKVRLVIAGNDYYINTDEDEDYIRSLAAKLEKDLIAMSNGNPCLSTTMAAVLCALEYSDECSRRDRIIEQLKDEARHAIADSASATVEANEAIREITRLSEANLRLRRMLENK